MIATFFAYLEARIGAVPPLKCVFVEEGTSVLAIRPFLHRKVVFYTSSNCFMMLRYWSSSWRSDWENCDTMMSSTSISALSVYLVNVDGCRH